MRPIVAASAACLVCTLGAGSARQAPQQPAPSFRASVKLVVVDVSVLDENRVPVRGLMAGDFTILEDGKPQPVATFDAVDVPDVEEAGAVWMKEVAPDVQRNDGQAGRLMVIVLDDAVPMPKGDIPYARAAARRVIEHLGPSDLAAVVYTVNQRNGQEFTADRGRLLAAVERFSGGIMGDAPSWDVFDDAALTMYQASVGTLRGVAESLMALPQRRKALVYVSVGIPVDVEKVDQYVPSDGTVHVADEVRDLSRQIWDLFRSAQQANVNVYSLDPGGLRVGPGGESEGKLTRDFLQAVSTNTGGIAVVNTNDAEPGITQIFRENGSYYLLGYEAPNPQSQGKTRRIEVRVSRPGLTVRSRREYYEPRAKEPGKAGAKAAAPPSPFADALTSVVPKTDIAMQATAATFAGAAQGKAAVAIAVHLRVPRPPITERADDEISVQMTAYDGSGKSAGADAAKVHLALKPGATGDIFYEVLGRLDLVPGRYQLRAVATSSLQGKSGSVHADLEVHDYSKDRLALSGAVLSATPGFASGPRERLASLLPVVPTTQREYLVDDQVVAFVRVYQGGKEPVAPVVVRGRIVNARGDEVFAREEVLEASRFSGARSADFRMALPLAALDEGAHLLTIDAMLAGSSATGGQNKPDWPVRRDVRFGVRQ